jgi:hypothetical protein
MAGRVAAYVVERELESTETSASSRLLLRAKVIECQIAREPIVV